MGFLDEIKKVLFGAKAVSKSAAGKIAAKGKDVASSAKDRLQDIEENLSETAGDTWEKAGEVGDKVKDKAGEVLDDVKDFTEDVGSKVLDKVGDLLEDAKEFTEDVGSKFINKAEDLFDDAKEFAGDVGEKVNETAEDAINTAKDVGNRFTDKIGDAKDEMRDKYSNEEKDLEGKIEDVEFLKSQNEKSTPEVDSIKKVADIIGSKVIVASSDLSDRAKEVGEKMSDKLDDTVRKAKELAAEEAAEPKYKDPNPELGKSSLEDKDDFFAKAAAFADGRYEDVRDPFSDKPKIVGKNEVEKPINTNLLPGFEDLDGDGNEIIDDALIEEE